MRHPFELIGLRVKGLHYLEVMRDNQDKPVNLMMFTANNDPVREVFEYLEWLRKFKTGSFNALKRHAYDLMHFYDYLSATKVRIEFLQEDDVAGFITYLIMMDPKPDRSQLLEMPLAPSTFLSIERSLWKRLPIQAIYYTNKVIALRPGTGLSQESIGRIVNRAKLYLVWLASKSLFKQRFAYLNLDRLFPEVTATRRNTAGGGYVTKQVRSVQDYLGARGIRVEPFKVERVSLERIFEEEEVEAIKATLLRQKKANVRDHFLFVLLEAAGLRIGEALGLRLETTPDRRLAQGFSWVISGDITCEGEDFTVHVVPRSENPPDRQVKDKQARSVTISAESRAEFGKWLSHYLGWRNSVMIAHGVEEHGWLIVNRIGQMQSYNACRAQFLRTKAKAGLSSRTGLTLHSYRHYNISRDINRGVAPYVKQRDAGHERLDTTLGMYWTPDRRRLSESQDRANKWHRGDEQGDK